jgi:hypothetical protein
MKENEEHKMNKNRLLCFGCIVCLCLFGCRKKEGVNGVPYRPDGFPEILVPLEGATEIRYLSPETGKIVEGTYSISFWLDEEYPAKNTIEQIQSHLKSRGCVRVQGSVLNDLTTLRVIAGEGSSKEVVDIANDIRQELQNIQIPTETQWQKPNPLAKYAEYTYSTWSEEWITHEDDKISIVLEYYIRDGEEKLDQLYFYSAMFTRSSWMYPHVLRYKKNHPEQFGEPNSIEIKSPGG